MSFTPSYVRKARTLKASRSVIPGALAIFACWISRATRSRSGRCSSKRLTKTMSADLPPDQPAVNVSRLSSGGGPRGFTVLDHILLIAGLGLGFALHQNSLFRREMYPIAPTGYATYWPVLGFDSVGWLWAFVAGWVFVIVGRHFRYGGLIRPFANRACGVRRRLCAGVLLGVRRICDTASTESDRTRRRPDGVACHPRRHRGEPGAHGPRSKLLKRFCTWNDRGGFGRYMGLRLPPKTR